MKLKTLFDYILDDTTGTIAIYDHRVNLVFAAPRNSSIFDQYSERYISCIELGSSTWAKERARVNADIHVILENQQISDIKQKYSNGDLIMSELLRGINNDILPREKRHLLHWAGEDDLMEVLANGDIVVKESED